MGKFKFIFIDAAMVALMYFGLIKGNEYAANIFWPVFWVFVFLSILIMIVFSNEKAKEEVIKNRVPNPLWKEKYSFVYDLSFSLVLAALGFHWSGAVWFIISIFTGAIVKTSDEEIRKKRLLDKEKENDC